MKRHAYIIQTYRYPRTKSDGEQDLEELMGLVEAADHHVLGRELYHLRQINRNTGLGSGKLENLKEYFQEHFPLLDLILIDCELRPYQIKNIEDYFNVEVRDRTRLILDIFRRRAQSKEGILQVDLAEAEYELGRMTGSRGKELSRLGGGVGTRGPGEQIAERGRRAYRKKIRDLRAKLEKVSQVRATQQKRSLDQGYKRVSLVGYTNAGKSTLLNQLTKSKQVTAKNQVFTTVDPTTRAVVLEAPVSPDAEARIQQMVLVTDTVGFISRLPTELVEGFESTLEQVNQGDVALVVIDVSDPNYQEKEAEVYSTLERIGTKVPLIKVYNKFDRLKGPRSVEPGTVYLSAKTGEGVEELKREILLKVRK